MTAVLSDRAKITRWLEVELLATEAQAALGIVPAADAATCRTNAPAVTDELIEAIDERERITDHDVAAFVDVIQARIGMPAGAWIHHGLTSTDVVDTAQCWGLAQAADLLIDASTALVAQLRVLARAHRNTVTIGRTHGVHAEPTTFGRKVALWCLQADRDRIRLRAARSAVAVCKLSGAVGTYSNIDPRVEEHVAASLGLTIAAGTQVVARDRHAELLWACAATGATVETICVELRHLQRTEVREVEEGFKAGQKGSSAMPHKRNPITAERLSGLARVLRGNLIAGLENVALWHERDISHSSVERMILPDTLHLTYYLLRRCASLLSTLHVDAERMLANLHASHGVVFSQSVLLALVEGGLSRDDAYRIVQELARRAWTEGVQLRSLVEIDERVSLSSGQIANAFDLDRVLAHAGRVIDDLDSIDA
jgi:adenylosuccinate lyase